MTSLTGPPLLAVPDGELDAIGLVAVDGLRLHVAAQQADTLSALQVDCRNDEHAEPR
jgi:hypothetical protein